MSHYVRDRCEFIGRRSRRLADQALSDGELAVSAIAFWEIALLVTKRRLRSIDSATETRRLMLGAGFVELPLTAKLPSLRSISKLYVVIPLIVLSSRRLSLIMPC